MSLTEDQKQTVTGWIKAGASLNDVQKRLAEELQISLTYLDVRLLVAELNVVPKEKEKPQEAKPAPEPEPATAPLNADGLNDDPPLPGGGNVSVSIDQITRPNAMISGKATFSDGQRAEWYLDPMGRLALDPVTPGYRPSQEDVMTFQMELQRLASQQGL